MRAVFIADAHLRQPQDQNYRKLLDFLDQQENLDGLFLLGDIFEFWLGYRNLVFSAYIPLLEKLRQLAAAGTHLYFVEGNHDFNLGPYFSENLGCCLISDRKLVEWDGRKLLLSHGDLLNPNRSYHLLRSFWRSAPIRLLSRLIHPDPVWDFGIWLSDLGRKKRAAATPWDPTPLLRPLADSSEGKIADILICGHFHQPVDSQYQGKQLIVVGDWLAQYSYAEMIDGKITLKSYSD